MIERRFKTDICEIDASKIDSYEHDIFGAVTIFKDVVIARAIVHKYDDGMAYKPGKELQAGYWTADGMWSISGGHPSTAIIATRDEIHGRTVNVRFSKSLIDPDTKRPMNRGVLADLEVFNNKVSPELLSDMKSGKKNEVSIGFFFDFDDVSGVVDDEEDKALNGTAYDYVQRNSTINHVAFGIDDGRCPMPYCGIGADGVIRKVEGDPFGEFKNFADCVAKNQDKNNPEAYCASIEHTIKERRKKDEGFKPTEEDKLNMKKTIEEAKVYLKDVLNKLDAIEFIKDDLVEEEYQGNAGMPMTLSKRAKMFHSISDPDWDALTEAEKEGYISSLPPEKPHGESNKDEEHEHCVEGLVWSTEENKCVPADEEEDCEECDESESDVEDETDADESDEDDVAEILETTEDELDPDEVIAKYRRTLEDKDYPY